MSTDKPRAEKLSLAVRKNVRDAWEAKKPELEEKMAALVGVKWSFEPDPLTIYPYAEEDSYGQTSLGSCIFDYYDSLLYNLNYFLQQNGDSGKDELNSVCHAHVATLVPSTKHTYCGTSVEDGKLLLQFHPNNLGVNINNQAQQLAETLSKAPQPEGAPFLSYVARHSIKTDYTASIETVLEKVQKILQNPEFKFEPDFDALGAKLKTGGKDVRDDWEGNLGSFTKSYYESFLSTLEYEKFEGDEMLREGLAEGAPKGVLRLRIVDKLQTEQNGYNEIVLDDGGLVIQTTPERWGVNIHHSASKIVDIL